EGLEPERWILPDRAGGGRLARGSGVAPGDRLRRLGRRRGCRRRPRADAAHLRTDGRGAGAPAGGPCFYSWLTFTILPKMGLTPGMSQSIRFPAFEPEPRMSSPMKTPTTRRDFIISSAAGATALATGLSAVSAGAFVQGSDEIRVGLVGCGGRG